MSSLKDKISRPLRVARRMTETPDSISLILEVPETHRTEFTYAAGQFLSLFLRVNGQEISRSYSLSSSPLVDKDLRITVKRVAGGLGSNFLIDQIKEGDILQATPPAGRFYAPTSPESQEWLVLIGGGSGIAPLFSILKTALTEQTKSKLLLIYANRSEQDIIFHQELESWRERFSDRLQIVHILSQAKEDWCRYRGRCNEDLLKNLLSTVKPNQKTDFYLCGPQALMQMARSTIQGLGFTATQIHEESFGPAQGSGPWTEKGAVIIGENPGAPAEVPEKLIVTLNGETKEYFTDGKKTVLEVLIEAGENPPYSCMEGACMACMGKVLEGRVYQKDPGILTEDNIQQKETLTCQAHPLAKFVKITYDL